MEKTLKMSGAFFEWQMTVRVEPARSAEHPATEDEMRRAIERMCRLDQHFVDMVNLHEYGLQFSGADH